MSKIRSKKGNLFDYFYCNHKDLSAEYIKDCETFLINLGNKKKKKKRKDLLEKYEKIK